MPSQSSAVPRSGYRFLASIVGAVQKHAGPLAATLDAPHRKGGRKGHGAMPKLCSCLPQHVLNIRYASRFLSELDANPALLDICGLEPAPDAGAYSRFKKALTARQEAIARVMAEIRDELERLRATGIVPADAPQLGDTSPLTLRTSAYGNPKRSVPADQDASWGHRTARTRATPKKMSCFTATRSTKPAMLTTVSRWRALSYRPTRATGRSCPNCGPPSGGCIRG